MLGNNGRRRKSCNQAFGGRSVRSSTTRPPAETVVGGSGGGGARCSMVALGVLMSR